MTGLRRRIAALEVRRGAGFFSMSDEQLEAAYTATLDAIAGAGFTVPDHWRLGANADLRRTTHELSKLCQENA